MNTQQSNWGLFTIKNAKHRVILSLLHQAGWTVPNEKHGEVPDLERLSDFLKSPRSPVNKPLLKMKATELEKIISALQGVVKHVYK